MPNGLTFFFDWWLRFISPTYGAVHTYMEREYERRVRVFSGVLFFAMTSGIFTIFFFPSLGPMRFFFSFYYEAWVCAAIALSRMRGLQVAAHVYLIGFTTMVIGEMWIAPDTQWLDMLWIWLPIVIPAALAGLLLPWWGPLCYGALESLGFVGILYVRYQFQAPFALLGSQFFAHLLTYGMVLIVTFAVVGMFYSHQLQQAIKIAARSDELAMLNNRLETVLDTIQEGLFIFDQEGYITFTNKALRTMLPDMQGHLLTELTDIAHLRRLDGSVITQESFAFAYIMANIQNATLVRLSAKALDGRALILETMPAPLVNTENQIVGALTVLRDITAECRNEHHFAIIRAVVQACASAPDSQGVAQGALDAITQGLRIPNGFIITRNPDRPDFGRLLATYFHASHCPAEGKLLKLQAMYGQIPITPDAPIASLRVLATGHALFDYIPETVLQSANTDEPYISTSEYDHSALVPLLVQGKPYGVLALAWDASDVEVFESPSPEFLKTLAEEIATSLQRAQLYEDACRLALFDPLTGLYNHRSLQNMLQKEMALSMMHSAAVSIIMLDIDHFRRFNDAFGHDAGDRILRMVAQTIQGILRPEDFAARYGGEEFTVVLPNTDEVLAHTIAEQIRAALAVQDVIMQQAGTSTIPLTASLGHATFPQHASVPASLLKAADLALYAAKRAGRNRAMAYATELLTNHPKPNIALLSMANADSDELALPTGANVETIQAFITAIDLRDGYTAAHSEGVARYAVTIAQAMQLPVEHVEALHMGGLIHDIGKIGVSDQILRKPGKLTDEEWVQMRAHTTMGETILRPVEHLHHLLPLVRWHHERLDGSGYPDGLRETEIPELVRIISIADVFEAYTADRPYHPGRSIQEGLAFLTEEVQHHRLDGRIVAIFKHVLLRQVNENTEVAQAWFVREAA